MNLEIHTKLLYYYINPSLRWKVSREGIPLFFTLTHPDRRLDDMVEIIDGDYYDTAITEKLRRNGYEAPITDKVFLIIAQSVMMVGGVLLAVFLDRNWLSTWPFEHWITAYIALAAAVGFGYLIGRNINLIRGEFRIRQADISKVQYLYWGDPIIERLRNKLDDDWPWVRDEALNHASTRGNAIVYTIDNYAREFYDVFGHESHKAAAIVWTTNSRSIASDSLDDAAANAAVAIRALDKARRDSKSVADGQRYIFGQALADQETARQQSYTDVGAKLAEQLAARRSQVETTR